jgi:hypothetical protein
VKQRRAHERGLNPDRPFAWMRRRADTRDAKMKLLAGLSSSCAWIVPLPARKGWHFESS